MDVRFRILGPLTITDSRGVEVPIGALKPRQLVAAFLLHRGHLVSTEMLLDCLWGEAAPPGAATTLRTYIAQVRQVLGTAGVPATIEATRGGYRFDVDGELLDVDLFESLSTAGKEAASAGRHHEAVLALREANALWRGELLQDLGRPTYAEVEAARLGELRVAALETYLDSLLAVGGHEEAVPQLRGLVREFPYRERLAAQLALALYRCGRQAEALEAVAAARRVLADELGLDPGAELRELEVALLQQDPDLEHGTISFTPSRVAPGEPIEMTSFIGRADARRRIRELLDENRAVTLTGFGGVGKTRLAVRVAQDVRRSFDDGVHFVALADVDRGTAVADSIAEALGLDGWSAHTAEATVTDYLAARTALLVLDNCEHVVEAAAKITDLILHSCPGVSILATSREPLRIGGETIFPVPPMKLGEEVDGGDSQSEPSEAMELFVARAKQRDPDFALTPEVRAAVEDVCRKVEGIPLAIELAVARLSVLSPQELSENLTHHWRALNRGDRGAPARQTTMAACIDWSFDLSTPAERQLWARSSVFVDSFDLEAAGAVSPDVDQSDLADDLASLVEKSILIRDRYGGVTRFRLLPPLRERGLAELARSGDEEAVRRLHRDFFVELVVQFHAERFGRRQLAWIHRLRHELNNLGAAIDHCAATPQESAVGLRAMAHLMEFLSIEGLFRQARRWVDVLIAADDGATDTQEGAHALAAAGWWSIVQGDLASAAELLNRSRRVLAATPDGLNILTQIEGFRAVFGGDTALASVLYQQAVDAFASSGDRQRLGQTLSLLALARALDGDLEGTMQAHRGCLDITEPDGELWLRGHSYWAAGLAALGAGDHDHARQLLRESLRLRRALGERLGVACGLESLAYVAAATDAALATTLLGAAENEWERIETSSAALPGMHAQRRAAVTHLRHELDDAGFATAWQRGRDLSQHDAVALALGEGDHAATDG